MSNKASADIFFMFLGFAVILTTAAPVLIRLIRRMVTGQSPLHEYETCHIMLRKIVLRAWDLLPIIDAQPPLVWTRYTISPQGMQIPRLNAPIGSAHELVPAINWSAISGVGLEMSPLYEYEGPTYKGGYNGGARRPVYYKMARATRINTGYQFIMLIVIANEPTQTIGLPLNNDAAINFAAHVLAFARSHERRLSLMGFDKGMTRQVVHLEAF